MQAMRRQLVLALILGSALAAEEGQFILQPDYAMRIEGTSNLRNWSADVGALTVDFSVRDWPQVAQAALRPEQFASLALRVPVAEIASGTKGLAGKIHKYLDEKKHPFITFKLHRVTGVRIAADTTFVRVEGTINAAGVDHTLFLDTALTMAGTDTLLATGSAALKMTDFDIEPPTALFGTIRAVDEFTVSFTLPFRPNAPGHVGLH